MKILSSLIDIQQDSNSIVTVGTFDGVHQAHQKILTEVVHRARERKGRSVVVTFNPHPRTLVGKNAGAIRLLTTLEERIALLQKFDIEVLLIVPFTYEFSRLTPRQFYKEYVVGGIGVAEVIEGYDHSFGRDREARIAELQTIAREFGFGVRVIEPVTIDGDIVGSSKIRKHLEAGNVRKANLLLGRIYSADGIVVEGEGRGPLIGFPTANISIIGERKLIPARGVYVASMVMDGSEYPGMLNIGTRPTFTETTEISVEIHLFNFSEEIYGRRVQIRFYDRIRDEKRFVSPETLAQQLRLDAKMCKAYMKNKFHIGT
ncbi:MAG: bifunctional riboflavin kinase/FAD synthetase [Bacteroidota bacterium]